MKIDLTQSRKAAKKNKEKSAKSLISLHRGAPSPLVIPANSAPQRHQSFFAVLLVTLFSLPALQPLFNGRLTCGFDNVFHLWRSVQMGTLLENGILFSRWAPNMAHGYGYPLYLYQAPFSAYVAALFQASGVSWTTALNVVYGLGIVASGWTMWLLARDLWGERGAIVAAVAYVFAPFHAYVAYYRASLSETLAWLFVPLVLWGLLRWQAENRQRRGLLTAVVSFILLMFTHDVTAYLFFPFIVGWVAVLALMQKSWGALGRGLLALLLGMGGSAFFWLPALMARPFIQFERANSGWPFLYFNNFLPLEQLLALPRNADPSFLNDWPQRGIGLLLLGLALIGALIAWRKKPDLRWLVGYLGLGLLGYILLTGVVSRPLWDNTSLLQAFQFPWRFLAPATLLAALLSGGCSLLFGPLAAANGRRIGAVALPLLLITLLSAAHWGWFYPQLCTAPTDTSLAGLVAWEKETDTVGTTAGRELLPTSVQSFPQDANDLPVWNARLAQADLPEGATILSAAYAPLRADIELETAVPFRARFRAFAFPGWRVWLDGEPLDITPSEPEGLITFPVPAGRSTIRVAFGETPLRILANVFSLLSVAVLGLLLLRPKFDDTAVKQTVIKEDQRQFLVAAFILALALIFAKLWLADAGLLPMHRTHFAAGEWTQIDQSSQLTFGTPANPAMVRLLGHDALPTAVAGTDPLTIALYWQALTPLTADYRVGLTLISENGLRWSADDLRDYRWTRGAPPAPSWQLDKFVQTAFFVDLLSGTPPGTYDLELSLFDKETLTPLTVYAEGLPLGPALKLTSLEIEVPKRPLPADSFTAQHSIQINSPRVQVSGISVDRAQAAPGDPVFVTIFWQNETGTSQPGRLLLQDVSGTAVAEWPLAFPSYGDGYFRMQHQVQLPVSLADGPYTWQLALPEAVASTVGNLSIRAPQRILRQPDIATAVGKTLFQDATAVATLIGYEINQAACGQTPAHCPLTLLWKSEAETSESYRVFVQIVDETGNLLAQADGIPANWTRPTTGWLSNEYIRDVHELNTTGIASWEDVQIWVGLYLTADGRLQTSTGGDTIVLPFANSQ